MSYFNFERLIAKYSAQYTLIKPSTSAFIGGHYINNGETKEQRTGAIIALSMSKIQQSGGYLTRQDRYLYETTPITGSLEGATVIFDNNKYSIEEDTQIGNERFTGVSTYILKWVSHLGGKL